LKVRLISNDRKLYSTCRKVLVKLQDVKWDLAVYPSRPSDDGEVYIWDFEADPSLEGFDQVRNATNIFVVERENVSALRAKFKIPPMWILLKPVSPVLLEGFLGDAGLGRGRSAANEQQDAASIQRDRDDMLQALLESNLLLQEIDQARRNSVAQSFRELRSPLMATLGYCRLLLDQQLGPLNAEQQKVIQRMQQSAQRLFRLSSSMLQSALGSDVPLMARFQAGDIEDCIERAVAEVAPFADARNLVIQRDVTPPGSRFMFDPEQVTQLLANLLDNAVRSTSRGGQITIRTLPVFWDRRARNLAEGAPEADRRVRQMAQPNAYRVEVSDPGIGLRQAALENNPELLAPDALGVQGSSQAGFGLGMCQQIIEAHRGRIIVETGETGFFAFEIPYVPSTERVNPAASPATGRSVRAEA
jgi:signal transduction histidine kinase